MSFPHEAEDFGKLLRIVAERHGLSVALVEKDYWVTLTLWALMEAGFEIWFKGGTSLSKGFGLITRFSEDLDLRIDPGKVKDLAAQPGNWTSGSQGQIRKRIAYYESLPPAIRVPGAEVRVRTITKDGSAAVFEVLYPGQHLEGLRERGLRPFVQIEAGRARVVPCVRRNLTSFVHDHLHEIGQHDLAQGTAPEVRCAHPFLTLLDKLDAITRRFDRGDAAVDFVRHYEDSASIVRSEAGLPELGMAVGALAAAMLSTGDIGTIPSASAGFLRPQADRLAEIEQAHAAIQGMFWGDRIPIAECCRVIRDWILSKEW